jgi:PKD repeat protein
LKSILAISGIDTTMGHLFKRVTIAAGLMLSAACTTSQVEVPALTGPSELGQSVRLTATPDSLSQDGASQSAVVVAAFDPNGRPISGLAFRMDMGINGVLQDFGRLSARTIVTGADGRASTVYTAPPPPPPAAGGSSSIVTIVATATSNNFQTSNPQMATIRLVPPGVILPPAGTPTASFTITPTPVNVNIPATFDASASLPGSGASSIALYSWDFGDGGTGSGRTVNYTFRTVGTFNVTLTVTNDRGVAASSRQAVSTNAPDPFTGSWDYSPAQPAPGQKVLFNAIAVQTEPGHRIVSYSWDFGDSWPGNINTASGLQAEHTYSNQNDYVVLLTVVDDAGRQKTISRTVAVKFPTGE